MSKGYNLAKFGKNANSSLKAFDSSKTPDVTAENLIPLHIFQSLVSLCIFLDLDGSLNLLSTVYSRIHGNIDGIGLDVFFKKYPTAELFIISTRNTSIESTKVLLLNSKKLQKVVDPNMHDARIDLQILLKHPITIALQNTIPKLNQIIPKNNRETRTSLVVFADSSPNTDFSLKKKL